nr:MAG TPA: MYST MYST family zinc finger domain [Caudoviricetes sp.]
MPVSAIFLKEVRCITFYVSPFPKLYHLLYHLFGL